MKRVLQKFRLLLPCLALAALCANPQTAAGQQMLPEGTVEYIRIYTLTGDLQSPTATQLISALDLSRFSKNACDCKQRYRIAFRLNQTLVMPTMLTGTVEVWAGLSCDDISSNQLPRQQRCKQIGQSKDIKTLTTEQIIDLTADEFLVLSDSSGADARSCQEKEGPVTLFVLVNLNSDNTYEAKGTLQLNYDGVAPPPPTDVRTSSGDKSVALSWTADGNLITADGGFQLLCKRGNDPAKTVTFVPAFANGCAEAPGSTVIDARFLCTNRIPASARAETVSGLENDVAYAFGVVAYDKAGNPSKVTDASYVQGVPIPTTDGYELYRQAGGRATGGFCHAAPGERPHGHAAGPLALLGVLLIWAAGRRSTSSLVQGFAKMRAKRSR